MSWTEQGHLNATPHLSLVIESEFPLPLDTQLLSDPLPLPWRRPYSSSVQDFSDYCQRMKVMATKSLTAPHWRFEITEDNQSSFQWGLETKKRQGALCTSSNLPGILGHLSWFMNVERSMLEVWESTYEVTSVPLFRPSTLKPQQPSPVSQEFLYPSPSLRAVADHAIQAITYRMVVVAEPLPKYQNSPHQHKRRSSTKYLWHGYKLW